MARTQFFLALSLAATTRLASAQEPPPPESAVEGDVAPTLTVFSSNGVSLALGALVQLHLAPYVGDDALLANDDPEAREGFRLRRARFGVDADFPADLHLLLVLNPLESDPEVGAISEARVAWTPRPWFRIWAGADKVPFSRGELQSTAELASIERPLTVQTLVPQRRLGAVVEGEVAGGALSWVAGVMNATEGYERGNQFSGLLYVARLQGMLGSRAGAGLALAAGGYFEDGPATNRTALSADLEGWVGGASLLVEGICDRTEPDATPETSPQIPDEVDRCGAYAEAGYRLPQLDLQPLARVEWLDDNRDLEDAGDALLLAVGLNYRPSRHVRMQLHYLGRYERESAERANDAVVLNLQGDF